MKSNLDPRVLAFMKQLEAQHAPPIYTVSPEEARKSLLDIQREAGFKQDFDLEYTDIKIPGGPIGDVSVCLVRPRNSKVPLPIIMYFHGGGWILGNFKTHERLVGELAMGSQAAIAFVEYTPSPEAHFPVALEEGYLATAYITQRGKEYNLDTSKMVVGGDSVGGNMATIVALLCKERGGPHLSFQVLFYPVTDGRLDTPSYKEFENGPWLSKKAMEWYWNAYEPNRAGRAYYLLSPLQAALEQLKDMPPALIITAENDVLRDEGEAYAHKLAEADVDVTAVRYLGTMHDFVMLNALKDTPQSKSAIHLACCVIKKQFIHN